jgi:hypothetical protein
MATATILMRDLMMINHCSLAASSFTVEALQAQSGTRPRAQTLFHVSDPANAAVFLPFTLPALD